jgi:hypothetical protein
MDSPSFTELDEDFLNKLEEQHAPPKQVGPLRFHDKEMRCSNRGCGSPTYLKVQGVPRCGTHSLIELNAMLVEAGFNGVG